MYTISDNNVRQSAWVCQARAFIAWAQSRSRVFAVSVGWCSCCVHNHFAHFSALVDNRSCANNNTHAKTHDLWSIVLNGCCRCRLWVTSPNRFVDRTTKTLRKDDQPARSCAPFYGHCIARELARQCLRVELTVALDLVSVWPIEIENGQPVDGSTISICT